MALDLVVSGATGRMGQALARLIAEAEDLRALGGIAPDADAFDGGGYPEVVQVPDAGEMLRRAEVVIDFSAPDQLSAILELHRGALAGKAVLVGTTGLDASLESDLDRLAEHAPVVVAANFSVGVNLLLGLVEQAARALTAAEYDIEIVETHHNRKEDAPSGTALALGRAIARARDVALEDVRVDGRSGRTGPRSPGPSGSTRSGAAASRVSTWWSSSASESGSRCRMAPRAATCSRRER